jgi:hypothetical protein
MSARIWGLALLPVAAGGIGYELNKARLAIATAKWTKVPCTISRLEIVPQDSAVSDEETFEVVGAYSYQVDGQDYSSEKISARHTEFLKAGEADKLLAGVPASGPHFDYYNPEDPKQAVLVPGNDNLSVKELATFAVLLGVAIFLILKH